jgi:hypothetical protein
MQPGLGSSVASPVVGAGVIGKARVIGERAAASGMRSRAKAVMHVNLHGMGWDT